MRRFLFHISLFVCLHCTTAKAQESLYANTFPLSDVVLLSGPFQHARDLNIKTLLQYSTDRLLAPYRKEAGLQPKDSSYKNWEGLDGHVGGHYLSAMALNWASVKNAECKKRMDYMVAELAACQEANANNHPDWGRGYVGGVPNSAAIWSALKGGNFGPYRGAWVPWYNVHKTYAGLRDAWLYGGSEKAKDIFLKFCDWAINLTAGLSEQQMQAMLDVEHGGMNEMFADAFQITKDKKYLEAARRFSHHQILNPLSQGKDNLDNKHANTQVPKAIGFQRIGELTGDDAYQKAGSFFWETVTGGRSLAIGGNSRREFFPSALACTDFVTDVEGPESCNSYNMLKLTQGLFREKPDAKYIDFFERALYNHILSTQHPGHGGYVYFTPARPRHYRVYSSPNAAMWCCVGSGMENHGKYNEYIYTHQGNALYVNLFIPSELTWKEKGVKLRQQTAFPYEANIKLTVVEGSGSFPLNIRYPSWVKGGALKIKVNGKAVAVKANPSSYVTLNRTWKKGDVVEVVLPMHTRIEHLPNVPEYVALLHGPIVLGAKTGAESLRGLVADDSRWGHIAHGARLPIDKAPILVVDELAQLPAKLQPVKGKPLHFTFSNLKMENPVAVELEPFYSIHDARYMMYWMALTNSQYRSYLDSLSVAEKEAIALQARTVDAVAPGEQQPEVDHGMQTSRSRTGTNQDRFYREAANGGYFSYNLNTDGETALSLLVQYWGAEWGSRKFELYVDDQKLATEDNTGRWNVSKFQTVEYKIPEEMLRGKKTIRVKFQSVQGNTAGGVYGVRLLRKEN